MEADAPELHQNAARPMADAKAEQNNGHDHERGVEEREAFEAWGYMFKPDKTGTDKLKALLRGLKDVLVCRSIRLLQTSHLILTRFRTNIMSRPITQT